MNDQRPQQGLSPDARAIINAIYQMDERHKRAEDQKHEENKRQIESILATQRQVKAELEGIARGFPDGDPESHRRYHEQIMEWHELRNKMVREALVNAAKAGGIAGLAWIAYAVWTAFKMEIMR